MPTAVTTGQHARTARMDVHEVAAVLVQGLGPTLVAAMTGSKDRKLPSKWAKPDGPRPSADFARRLRRASHAFTAPNAVVQLGPGSPSPQDIAVSTGGRARAIVGDAEAWQAHWGAVMSLRSSHQVVVDGYPAADFRALTRQRELPPPLNPGSPAFWLLPPEGGVLRARIG